MTLRSNLLRIKDKLIYNIDIQARKEEVLAHEQLSIDEKCAVQEMRLLELLRMPIPTHPITVRYFSIWG